MLCFVAEKKAVCRIGDGVAAFYVLDTPQGVCLKPVKLI